MEFRHKTVIIGVLFPLLLIFHGIAGASEADTLTQTRLGTAIDLAATYLTRAVGPEGRFVYRAHHDPTVKLKETYNELRHAGALYALATYYHRWRPEPALRQALPRAARHLRACCLAPLPANPELLAVWSTGTTRPQAKLGGAGLALVALLSLERIEPGHTPMEDLRGLGRFILFMQKPDGGFYSKFVPAEGGRRDRWVSLYYPGEAALGLLMLHEHDPDPAWLRGAAKAIAYLARSREGLAVVPADHWALLATAKLLPRLDRHELPITREVAIRHAAQICESILREQIESADPALAGGFVADGRTAPTATRLEGLLAALTFLPEGALKSRVETAARTGMAFLLRAQVREGPLAGGMPRAVRLSPEPAGENTDEIGARAHEIRIDYVQHALSAMLQYAEMFGPPAPRDR